MHDRPWCKPNEVIFVTPDEYGMNGNRHPKEELIIPNKLDLPLESSLGFLLDHHNKVGQWKKVGR